MIKLEKVSFSYSEKQHTWALQDISLNIKKGKYYAVLGHNGSGKSTLSKIISGIYKPQKGKVFIDNIEMSSKTLSEIRKKIGIIFQNPDNQFVGATVEEDITFSLENKCVDPKKMKDIITELATKVNMLKYLDNEPQFLSGGQKQRVAIASILALNPDIIIFDEITSMLDPKGKYDVVKIINELRKQGDKTLISITHNMNEAVLADELLVFSQGRLIAQGEPKHILNNKEIIEKAKIDSPFIYKLSSLIQGISPTYDEDELLDILCK